MRNRNSDCHGNPFSILKRRSVWIKAFPISGYNQDEWRHDTYGNVIKNSDYGNTASMYGWEIDHIVPVSRGGTDNINNLQPLQWGENRQKGNQYPYSG